jgi:hypothetical protein
MTYQTEILFESIESAKEYLMLLAEAVRETRQTLEADVSRAPDFPLARRVEALRLVSYNLTKLERHVRTSQRILNDLRTLRRLLLQERPQRASSATAERTFRPNVPTYKEYAA